MAKSFVVRDLKTTPQHSASEKKSAVATVLKWNLSSTKLMVQQQLPRERKMPYQHWHAHPWVAFRLLPDDGYYFKIATNGLSKGKISPDMSIEEIVHTVATHKKLELSNFTVIMLERERHADLLARLRKMGIRIILITDGDIAGSIVTCLPDSGIDLLIGAGQGRKQQLLQQP